MAYKDKGLEEFIENNLSKAIAVVKQAQAITGLTGGQRREYAVGTLANNLNAELQSAWNKEVVKYNQDQENRQLPEKEKTKHPGPRPIFNVADKWLHHIVELAVIKAKYEVEAGEIQQAKKKEK